MPCNQLAPRIDEFMDGDLPAAEVAAIERHLVECAACRAVHAIETELRSALATLPVARPRDGFFEQAMAHASRRRRRGDLERAGGLGAYALAAVATVVLAIGVMTFAGRFAPDVRIPEVTLALESTTSVNLVFSTKVALMDARVSLELPDGIEVVGYPGHRKVTWSTDLREGKNALRVPLLAHAAIDDRLIARLSHDDFGKSFELRVKVN